MSDCERIEPALERWIDGELNAADGAMVRDHVSDCARCRAAQRGLEQIHAQLHHALVEDAPKLEFAPFWRAIEGRLHERPAWHREILDRLRSAFAPPRTAWAIPAVIALLIGLFSYDSYFSFGRPRNNLATVVSIDSHGRSVALLREDESKTTVIWLYQNPEGDDEAVEETPQPGPAF